MRVEEYSRLQRILSLERYIPGWDNACNEMMYMPLKERKVIATLCRSQVIYPRNSTTYIRLIENISILRYNMFERLCTSSLNCSILLLFSKLSPYSNEEVEQMKIDSAQKEISCMTKSPRKCELNWNCIFTSSEDPMHSDIPYNKHMSKTVLGILQQWRLEVCDLLLVPRMSAKTIEKSSDNLVREEHDYGSISQIDLELHFEKHGVHIQGPCELRQRFQTGVHEVRTYYAMGGTAYEKSKYVKKMFDLLVNSFVPCDSKYADKPQRLEIENNEKVYFYDLTSFTSNLHEHYEFLYRLGLFCEGYRVNIFNSRNGIETVDLGCLIHEYNVMNNSPEVSLHNIEKGVIIEQLVAGLLGVNGNMATAKTLHTIVMMQTISNINKLNIVGDDGAIVCIDEQTTILALQTIGTIKEEKAFLSSNIGCIHLKRPIKQVLNRLIQGVLFSFPSFEYTYDTKHIDPRFTILALSSVSERQNSTAGSIVNLLNAIRYITFTSDEVTLVKHMVLQTYKWINLPTIGNVPQLRGHSSYGFVACIEGDYMGKDPIEYTINIHYNQVAKIQRREYISFNETMRHEDTFECNSNSILSYLEKLGYVESQKQSYSIYGDLAKNMLYEEYFATIPVVNTYIVLHSDFSQVYPLT